VLCADGYFVVSSPLFLAHSKDGVGASFDADTFTVHVVGDGTLTDLAFCARDEGY
jgi:hypothetical protein